MTRALGSVGLGAIWDEGTAVGLAPSALLDRFAEARDEASFAAIVARHGPMVRATCRRILPGWGEADVDDAFQATFLVLARRAGSIRDGDRLAPWLHSVARRAAGRVRSRTQARLRRETEAAVGGASVETAADSAADCLAMGELQAVLDEELGRLPEKYRVPLVLCYLDGLTHDEAARQLAWPVGTVRSRLAGGRDRLRSRLTRRGFAPGVLAVLSSPTLPLSAVSPLLRAESVRLVFTSAATARGVAPVAAVLVARGVQTSMILSKMATGAALALGTCAVGTTLGVGSTSSGTADGPQQQPAPSVTRSPDGADPQVYTDAQLVPYGQFTPKQAGGPTQYDVNIAYPVNFSLKRQAQAPPHAGGTRPAEAPKTEPIGDLDAALARIKALEAELAVVKARAQQDQTLAEQRLAQITRSNEVLGQIFTGLEEKPALPTVPTPPAPPDTRIFRPTLPAQEVNQPQYVLVPQPNISPYYTLVNPDPPAAPVPPTPPDTRIIRPTLPAQEVSQPQYAPTTAANVPYVALVGPYSPAAPVPPQPPKPGEIPATAQGTTKRQVTVTTTDAPNAPIPPTPTRPTTTAASTMPLPGTAKVLIVPARRESVTVFDPRAKTRATYRASQGTSDLFPVYSAGVVGLSLNGPQIRQIAAFSNQGDQWVEQDLREPAQGSITPTLMEYALTLRAGRFYYGFSAVTNRWAVLEMKPAPDGVYPGGVSTREATFVTEGDTVHVFDHKTGEWSSTPADDSKEGK